MNPKDADIKYEFSERWIDGKKYFYVSRAPNSYEYLHIDDTAVTSVPDPVKPKPNRFNHLEVNCYSRTNKL